jgi:excisionase family DNA binding protein
MVPPGIPAADALSYIVPEHDVFANFAMTNEEILTVEQLASELKLTPQTIRNWIRTGVLPAVKVGHVFRIKRGDVDAMLTRHQGETGPLGTDRDLWAPETLGAPYRPREDTSQRSIWDGTSSPPLPSKHS